jgi:hypothetical protein
MRQDRIIETFKYYIDHEKYDEIQKYYEEIVENKDDAEYRLNYEYIFQKVFLYACLKKKMDVVEFMNKIYLTFDIVEQIALKPTLIYGKYIIK